MRFKVLDDCAVPRSAYPTLKRLKKRANKHLGRPANSTIFNSLYRGDDAKRILHAHGKSTQRELYEDYLAGRGLPANPPTMGTHILKGDGTVGSPGHALPVWRLGMDSDYTSALIAVAPEAVGAELYRPYNTASEFHHVNFRSQPRRWSALFNRMFPRKKRRKR